MPQQLTPPRLRAMLCAAGYNLDTYRGKFEAAERIGVSVRTLYRWLHGYSTVSAAYAALIARQLSPTISHTA